MIYRVKSHANGPKWACLPSFLKNIAWRHGAEIKIEVDEHWITETVRFDITSGVEEKIDACIEDINTGLKEFNEK